MKEVPIFVKLVSFSYILCKFTVGNINI